MEPQSEPYLVSECAIKNGRRKMEDRHFICHNLNSTYNLNVKKNYSYYGIFDGHSGPDAADFSAAHLHEYLVHSRAFSEGDIISAFKEAFSLTELNFLEKSVRENINSGCTALCCLIEDNSKVYIAWCGDSQATIIQQGRPVELMQPHKPEREDEKQRIEELGGIVLCADTWRVNGVLAVSRAIGDPDHKPYVCADPDIEMFPLKGTEDFIILACDGLWDQVSFEDATTTVYEHLAEINNENTFNKVKDVSDVLAELAMNEGSSDNITCIVVFLKDPKSIVNKIDNNQMNSKLVENCDFNESNEIVEIETNTEPVELIEKFHHYSPDDQLSNLDFNLSEEASFILKNKENTNTNDFLDNQYKSNISEELSAVPVVFLEDTKSFDNKIDHNQMNSKLVENCEFNESNEISIVEIETNTEPVELIEKFHLNSPDEQLSNLDFNLSEEASLLSKSKENTNTNDFLENQYNSNFSEESSAIHIDLVKQDVINHVTENVIDDQLVTIQDDFDMTGNLKGIVEEKFHHDSSDNRLSNLEFNLSEEANLLSKSKENSNTNDFLENQYKSNISDEQSAIHIDLVKQDVINHLTENVVDDKLVTIQDDFDINVNSEELAKTDKEIVKEKFHLNSPDDHLSNLEFNLSEEASPLLKNKENINTNDFLENQYKSNISEELSSIPVVFLEDPKSIDNKMDHNQVNSKLVENCDFNESIEILEIETNPEPVELIEKFQLNSPDDHLSNLDFNLSEEPSFILKNKENNNTNDFLENQYDSNFSEVLSAIHIDQVKQDVMNLLSENVVDDQLVTIQDDFDINVNKTDKEIVEEKVHHNSPDNQLSNLGFNLSEEASLLSKSKENANTNDISEELSAIHIDQGKQVVINHLTENVVDDQLVTIQDDFDIVNSEELVKIDKEIVIDKVKVQENIIEEKSIEVESINNSNSQVKPDEVIEKNTDTKKERPSLSQHKSSSALNSKLKSTKTAALRSATTLKSKTVSVKTDTKPAAKISITAASRINSTPSKPLASNLSRTKKNDVKVNSTVRPLVKPTSENKTTFKPLSGSKPASVPSSRLSLGSTTTRPNLTARSGTLATKTVPSSNKPLEIKKVPSSTTTKPSVKLNTTTKASSSTTNSLAKVSTSTSTRSPKVASTSPVNSAKAPAKTNTNGILNKKVATTKPLERKPISTRPLTSSMTNKAPTTKTSTTTKTTTSSPKKAVPSKVTAASKTVTKTEPKIAPTKPEPIKFISGGKVSRKDQMENNLAAEMSKAIEDQKILSDEEKNGHNGLKVDEF